VLRSGLVTAFVLWAAVQLAPSFRGAALLNDGAIVLFSSPTLPSCSCPGV
jgi:hypothetical protein